MCSVKREMVISNRVSHCALFFCVCALPTSPRISERNEAARIEAPLAAKWLPNGPRKDERYQRSLAAMCATDCVYPGFCNDAVSHLCHNLLSKLE